ncbi:ATP-binding cassette domain-containing protein [Actinomyces sp. 2119]|uniref:ATP-binding cassette domain-containing protein n=1 Tax=Actinomyces lilanjuaniae TaxID=2321394 RepID=A0ABM6Z172_9ACTO|nr:MULTISPECIES: ATP-binding cassette domain-containing protein [Actinomyces]AYD88992.1 ATP-binding cassette domain-containing protein [Actinomyces lilanjuaniae]RJF41156.1 ATP-binding cassette domain-containing protein [Actinomyces sp. 2119]
MGTVLARLRRARVRYGDVDALNDVSLDLAAGRQLAVLGPSGAGKSTLLRLLTRELAPDSGSIEWSSSGLREGVVRQQPLLFDWLTIRENVALGQQFRANHVDQDLVGELMDLLGITPVAHSYPDQVSGGQAQRASFARALAIRPDLLILDEPFSALDPAARADLQLWLRRELTGRGLSSVLVTHDLDEALVLADDIVMIAAGRVTRRWANPEPAADQAAALHHPLRRSLREAYACLAPATQDQEDPRTAQATKDRAGGQAEDQAGTAAGRTAENHRAAP